MVMYFSNGSGSIRRDKIENAGRKNNNKPKPKKGRAKPKPSQHPCNFQFRRRNP